MLCQKCKQNNATSHLHYVNNGIVRDIYLCSDCAADFKAQSFYDGDIINMISNLLDEGVLGTKPTLKCECCGTDFNEIRRTGKVGCGNCYKVFEKQLASIISRLHGKTTHIGKTLNYKNCEYKSNERISGDNRKIVLGELKERLADAISSEEYEKAAVIRDEIRKLEE